MGRGGSGVVEERSSGVEFCATSFLLRYSSAPLLLFDGVSLKPDLRNVFQEADHLEGGFGSFGAFVADVAAGAVDGLFHCFAGEHAEQHRHVGIDREARDRVAHGAIDVLVVGRFAADDGT